jgi:hypothetical protein
VFPCFFFSSISNKKYIQFQTNSTVSCEANQAMKIENSEAVNSTVRHRENAAYLRLLD